MATKTSAERSYSGIHINATLRIKEKYYSYECDIGIVLALSVLVLLCIEFGLTELTFVIARYGLCDIYL